MLNKLVSLLKYPESAFAKAWTNITDVSGGRLLFCSFDTGLADSVYMDGAGFIHTLRAFNFGAGWSPIESTGDGTLLLYEPRYGAAVTARIDGVDTKTKRASGM